MTENTTESDTGRYDVSSLELADPPEDVPEGEATGYAVYDRVLRQYVSEVSKDKPKLADARKLHGHDHLAVVRV